MSNIFTLDDLNKAIETKYAPFYFQAGQDKYSLRQVLRLAKSERDFVVEELKKLDGLDAETMDEDVVLQAIENVLSTVTDGGKGSQLVELLGHDMVRVQMLMEMWIEATQPGEA